METTKGLVSVIVPVYKVEAYLADTVSCLLNQTYRNLEIILVDDGSPDRCGEMCDEYARQDDRVKVIHKANGGQATARNIGMDICLGEYLTFLDSDDVASEDYIEFLVGLAERYGTDMSFCMLSEFWDGENPVYDMESSYQSYALSTEEALRKFLCMNETQPGVQGKLFRKNLKEAIRFPEGIYYEDVWPIYNAIKHCERVAFGRTRKCGYRQRSTGQSKQAFSQKEMPCVTEWSRVFEDIFKFKPSLRAAASSAFLSGCAHIFFMIPSVKGYEKEAQLCWDGMRKSRGRVLRDPHARKKAWFCALLSLSGMCFTHWVGRKVLYH